MAGCSATSFMSALFSGRNVFPVVLVDIFTDLLSRIIKALIISKNVVFSWPFINF